MVDWKHYEPMEIAPGTPVTVLVTRRLGPWVFVPLHAINEKAAEALLHEFAGMWPHARSRFDEITEGGFGADGEWVKRPHRTMYIVGEAALAKMREVLEVGVGEPWPDDMEVVHLHG